MHSQLIQDMQNAQGKLTVSFQENLADFAHCASAQKNAKIALANSTAKNSSKQNAQIIALRHENQLLTAQAIQASEKYDKLLSQVEILELPIDKLDQLFYKSSA